MTKRVNWAKRLQAIRKAREWTQADLAREVGVHISTVSKWEQGLMVPHKVWRKAIEGLEG